MKVGTDGVLLGSWPTIEKDDHILDIGTGTGLIALMLAQREQESRIVGVEVDPDSAEQASSNVAKSPFTNHINIQCIDVQSYASKTSNRFDLIVSNPPFFTGGVLSDNMQRRQVRHTVKLSHNDLLRSVQLLLRPKGRFCVVLPWLEGLRFQEWAATYQLFTTKKCTVSPRPGKSPNRLLLQFEREEKPLQESKMSIYADTIGDKRSSEFSKLTKDYYLK